MEPLTLIVTALTLGIAAGLQSSAEQVIKDAYQSLKQLIERRYTINLGGLEGKPDSEVQRAAVNESLADAKADQDEDVLDKAKALIRLIESKQPETIARLNIDITDVEAASITVTGVQATGKGATAEVKARIKASTFGGDIKIGSAAADTEESSDPKN